MHTPVTLNEWLGYLFPAELTELDRLIKTLPLHARVLNIGAGGGVSSATILTARADVTLVSVDIQDTSSPNGCLASLPPS